MNGWYRKAQEYTGADATLSNGSHIQPFIDRLESRDGGGPVGFAQAPYGDGSLYSNLPQNKEEKKPVPKECEACHRALNPKTGPGCEISWGFYNDDGSLVYNCHNCGYTNNQYKIKYTNRGLGQPTRLKYKRKKSSNNSRIVIALGGAPYNPPPPMNPANTPFGRFDFSTDVRVVPWDTKVEGDFEETWDKQKQKKRVDYKFRKMKDKNGRIHLIPVKNPSKDTGVQQANIYTQKGDIKLQNRYRNDYDSRKNSQGYGYHNRAQDPSGGWYQADEVIDKNRFNSDARERVVSWEDWIANRNNQTFTLSKPF